MEGVTTVAYRPDGKVFATGGWDNTIRIWSAEGKSLRSMKAGSRNVTAVAFSKDGQLLASSSGDGVLRVWDSGSTKLLRKIPGRTGYLSDVAFGKGDSVFASGYDNRVKGWSASTGKRLCQFDLASDGYAVAVSSDGTLVAGMGPGGVSVFDPVSKKRVAKWGITDELTISCDYRPNSHELAFVAGNEELMLMQSKSGEVKPWEFDLPKQPRAMKWNPAGDSIAVSAINGPIMLLTINGEQRLSLDWHKDYVQALGFSPDSKILVSGDSSGYLAMWNADTGKFIRNVQK